MTIKPETQQPLKRTKFVATQGPASDNEHNFDFLALCFAQSAGDVRQLNTYLAHPKANIPLIAKIEKTPPKYSAKEVESA